MADRTGIPPRILDRWWLSSEVEEVIACRKINPFWGWWQIAAAIGLTAAGQPEALRQIMPGEKIIGEHMTDVERMQAIREFAHTNRMIAPPKPPSTPTPP